MRFFERVDVVTDNDAFMRNMGAAIAATLEALGCAVTRRHLFHRSAVDAYFAGEADAAPCAVVCVHGIDESAVGFRFSCLDRTGPEGWQRVEHPIDHAWLQAHETPTGPGPGLVVSMACCSGRAPFAQALADHFGCRYIAPSEPPPMPVSMLAIQRFCLERSTHRRRSLEDALAAMRAVAPESGSGSYAMTAPTG